ncbi:hypothetical protein [Shewanella sp.]|uniref:hypothetical protein n=1 Tax=Shewanella sp. TaxID=50422 RepID=UPI004053A73A
MKISTQSYIAFILPYIPAGFISKCIKLIHKDAKHPIFDIYHLQTTGTLAIKDASIASDHGLTSRKQRCTDSKASTNPKYYYLRGFILMNIKNPKAQEEALIKDQKHDKC